MRRWRSTIVVLVGVVALATATSALAAHPSAGARLRGKTSQGKAISFQVAKDGNRILGLRFYLITRCHAGFSWISSQGKAPSRTTSSIKAGGVFSLRITLPWHRYPAGYRSRANLALSGRFRTPDHATGVLKVVVHYSDGGVCAGRTVFSLTALRKRK